MTIVKAWEGEVLHVLTDIVTVKLGAAASARRLAVVTVLVPPTSGVAPHTHAAEDESFFVLAGCLRMTIGPSEHTLTPGDFVHLPAGTVHGYRNEETTPAHFLAWTLGGPLDEFFREVGRRVRSLPADASALQEVMARYGVSPVPRL